MAEVTSVLQDLFGRVAEELPRLLDGLGVDVVHWQPDPDANSIGWLAWHIGHGEDAQMAHVAGSQQVWLDRGWSERLRLPYRDNDIGYGHSADQVRSFRIENPADLAGYYADVHARTMDIIAGLTEADLDRVLDRRWDPPVTVGVRVVSIVNDVTQHLGQLAYVRGLWERSNR